MRIGIAGSAQVEGATRTHGIMGDNPTIKRVVIFWGIAVGILFVFHVGGARLG